MRPSSSAPALLVAIFAVSRGFARPPGHGSGPPPGFFGDDYENIVCHPMEDRAPNPVPPCMDIETIEYICTPNGTSPLALKAHQECRQLYPPPLFFWTDSRSSPSLQPKGADNGNTQGMCGGSFFAEWPFCLQCLFIHGLRSERDVLLYKSVLVTASNALCGVPTPTAPFQSIFQSAQGVVPVPTTGETISSDQAISQTAVSLYYTPSGSQGPGRITGEATAATATRLIIAPGTTVQTSESGGALNTEAASTGIQSTLPSTGGSVASIRPTASAVNTNGCEKARGFCQSWIAAVVAVAAGAVMF
ncbi:hypothetical protein B0H66DRAFT_529282 [Apodospora peruviana]|uniref:Uncharacterized protein n=1 Tax=Apodospora peruviana TaxID=516989 RepID=A0AAE0MB61_9PEZI|nr:hypothetical protein B0H66DRAFT_529282 [Apodospora peruviana]